MFSSIYYFFCQCFNCVIEFILGYAQQKTNTQAYLECTEQPQQVSMTQNTLSNLSIKHHLLSILKITFTHGCVCVCMLMCARVYLCTDLRTTCKNWFFLCGSSEKILSLLGCWQIAQLAEVSCQPCLPVPLGYLASLNLYI